MAQGKKTPEEKRELALAMLEAGKSYSQVASALNISISTVHNIVIKGQDSASSSLIGLIKQRLAGRNYLLADLILSWVSDLDLQYASLKDKAVAAAILIDKARLIEDNKRAGSPRTPRTPPSGDKMPSNMEKPAIDGPDLEHIKKGGEIAIVQGDAVDGEKG